MTDFQDLYPKTRQYIFTRKYATMMSLLIIVLSLALILLSIACHPRGLHYGLRDYSQSILRIILMLSTGWCNFSRIFVPIDMTDVEMEAITKMCPRTLQLVYDNIELFNLYPNSLKEMLDPTKETPTFLYIPVDTDTEIMQRHDQVIEILKKHGVIKFDNVYKDGVYVESKWKICDIRKTRLKTRLKTHLKMQ